MKKLKKVFSWFTRIGLSAVLISFLCVAPFTVFPSLIKAQSEVNRREEFDYQGILELWHVETFEGGSISRSKFLEREAINFETEHKGTYISIQTMSLEQFNLNLNAGKRPNMLSFGIGVGDEFLSELIALNCEDVRSDIAKGGSINSKQLAIPYILGGYATISTGGDKLGVGLNGTNNPLKAYQKNGIEIKNLYEDNSLDSYTAYDKFLKGEFDSLLGTQRDVYRCFNRNQKGLLLDAQFSFLEGYTDLVQYISVFKTTDIEELLCKEYVKKLISKDVQKKLANYNLFSVLNDVKLYESGVYDEFENTLKKPLEVENVFSNLQEIEVKKQNAFREVVK